MRDPITWSFPLGRLFGVTIRVHILLIIFFAGSVLRVACAPTPKHVEDVLPEGAWVDMLVILSLLFLSVLAHEFGHVFGARFVGGDCQEILMWPLGGLAYVEVPHTPRANFISTAAGPAVNVLLCVVCAALLQVAHGTPLQPHWWWPTSGYYGRVDSQGHVPMFTWSGERLELLWYSAPSCSTGCFM